jgi:flagellar motor protein MotB
MPTPTALLDCPVCPRRDLPASSAACPNCGTDLTLLRRIKALSEGLPTPAPAKSSSTLLGVLGALLLLSWTAGAVYLFRASQETDALRQQLAARAEDSEGSAGAARPANPPARWVALRDRLNALEGLVVQDGPEELRVGFRMAAFARGSEELLPRARQLLSRVATTLRSEGAPVRITLRGYTDETPVVSGGRWPDNWTLGLSRASSAARHFKKEWGEGEVEIEIKSASGALPPGAASLAEDLSRSVDLSLCFDCKPAGR